MFHVRLAYLKSQTFPAEIPNAFLPLASQLGCATTPHYLVSAHRA